MKIQGISHFVQIMRLFRKGTFEINRDFFKNISGPLEMKMRFIDINWMINISVCFL